MPTRSASAHWSGSLSDGSGTISTETSAIEAIPYSFDTRFGDSKQGTNPEELLGAAHAGCYTMQLSHMLAEAGHPPQSADTKAEVNIKQVTGGFEIDKIHLTLTATVPGISDDEFHQIAEKAKETCPLSKVLQTAEISLNATLQS